MHLLNAASIWDFALMAAALLASVGLLKTLLSRGRVERRQAAGPRRIETAALRVPERRNPAPPETSDRRASASLMSGSALARIEELERENKTLKQQLAQPAADSDGSSAVALSAAVTLTHDRLLLTDAEGRVRDVSPTALELMDLARSDLLGRRFHEAVRLYDSGASRPIEHPMDHFLDQVIENRSTLPRLAEALLIQRTGKRLSVLVSAAAILDGSGRLVGTLVRLEAYGGAAAGAPAAAAGPALPNAGAVDAATSLGNARAFERRLEELIKIARKHNQTHSLLFLSPDGFDPIVDEHGHWAGEELLWRIGQLLKDAAPEGGDAFRIAGHHLALLVPSLPAGHAKALAEQVRLAVDGAEFKWQDRVYDVTASIAVVPVPPDAEGHKVLLGLANKALASAKASGGNCVTLSAVDDTLVARRREDREWVAWVAQRLKEGHGHIVSQGVQPLRQGTRLKPLLDVQLRIADEKGRHVPSAAFLPSVVRHNLTATLDLWLLKRALKMLGEQPALAKQFQGLCLEVARPSLTEANFAERVAEVLAEHPAQAAQICFAIDARCAINHPSDVNRFVTTLKNTGAQFMLTRCKAALGLSALSSLPIHYVKIHESLMRKATENPLDFGYVRWINQVTHDLGRLTVAAGVDSPQLQDVAREIGLDYRQGSEATAPEAKPVAAAA